MTRLADGELFGEPRFLQRDADPLADGVVVACPSAMPSTSTSPLVAGSSPSRISIVVVLPAPLGPSRPKHSPRFDHQVEAAHGLDRRPAVVALDQVGAADGGGHGGCGMGMGNGEWGMGNGEWGMGNDIAPLGQDNQRRFWFTPSGRILMFRNHRRSL